MGRVLVECIKSSGLSSLITPYAANVSRTWALNDVGSATLTFNSTVPNLTDVIQWGNIYIVWETGIPPWVGICEDRDWDQGNVTLNLKAAEQLLAKHLTRQGVTIPAGTTAGAAAQTLFESAIGNDEISLLKRGIMDSGKPHFLQYDYKDLLDAYKELSENYAGYFWVDHNLYVHFRDSRGDDKSGTTALYEGRQLSQVKVTETIGEALTNAVVLGAGDDIIHKAKKTLKIPNAYYHRAEVLDFDAIVDPNALVGPATEALQLRSSPKVTIDATMLKTGSTWPDIFLGDVIRVVLYSRNTVTDERARIIGMELGETDEIRYAMEVIPQVATTAPVEWVLR